MHGPTCGSENKVNSGKVNPRQRYKCQQCGCNWTQSYQHGYRLDPKLLALQLYLRGNGLLVTGRILGLSNVTVLNWIQQFGTSIYRQKTKIMGLDCDQQIGPASHCLHHWRWQEESLEKIAWLTQWPSHGSNGNRWVQGVETNCFGGHIRGKKTDHTN